MNSNISKAAWKAVVLATAIAFAMPLTFFGGYWAGASSKLRCESQQHAQR